MGNFISEACKREIPEDARELLLSNVVDEEKHDLALSYCAQVWHQSNNYNDEAQRITKEWIDHPDHTVLKAMVLERSVFFVLLPHFRFNGDPALRTVSSDISRDEQVHVATNSLVCRELGLTVSPSLDELRKRTVAWVFDGLAGDVKYLNQDFWLEQSDQLLYQGKATGLQETKAARMPAFFEHDNSNLPQYN